jgi:hypothetical protein
VAVLLHRQDPRDKPFDDPTSNFWNQYRTIENILENTAMHFPQTLAATAGLDINCDLNLVFMNIAVHACAILLHQTVMHGAADKLRVIELRKRAEARCLTSAKEMVRIVQCVPDAVLLKVSSIDEYSSASV